MMMELRANQKRDYKRGEDYQGSVSQVITLKNHSAVRVEQFSRIFEDLELEDIHDVWAVRGEYTRKNLGLMVGQIEEWRIHKFYIWSNRNRGILTQIAHISFSCLKQLHVGWNRIETVQQLSQIEMPNLTDLVLRDNLITCFRSFQKSNFPKLKELCLRGNLINTLEYLPRCTTSHLTHINFNNNENLVNLRFLSAVEAPFLKVCRLRKQVECENREFFTVLRQKFIQLKVLQTANQPEQI